MACVILGDQYFWLPADPADWPEDKDELEIPAPGGPADFGPLYLHDLTAGTVSECWLKFDLEPGWLPEDGQDGRWCYPASPHFLSDRRIRLALHDGQYADLDLPLPDSVVLPAPGCALPPPGPELCSAWSGMTL